LMDGIENLFFFLQRFISFIVIDTNIVNMIDINISVY
jgi:hypothetical protein